MGFKRSWVQIPPARENLAMFYVYVLRSSMTANAKWARVGIEMNGPLQGYRKRDSMAVGTQRDVRTSTRCCRPVSLRQDWAWTRRIGSTRPLKRSPRREVAGSNPAGPRKFSPRINIDETQIVRGQNSFS